MLLHGSVIGNLVDLTPTLPYICGLKPFIPSSHKRSAMNSSIVQLLVLAGIAVFLILRLRSVLGTRDGFEQSAPRSRTPDQPSRNFEVIEGGPDRDITDHVDEGSPEAEALAKMKGAEPSFVVSDFLQGASGAYEMILMAYENGDLADVKAFLDEDVYAAFAAGIEARNEAGLTIDATFIGLRDVELQGATFDDASNEAELTIAFSGELSSTVRDRGGDIIEEESHAMKRQNDVWTFARRMGSDDPNWMLVATGE